MEWCRFSGIAQEQRLSPDPNPTYTFKLSGVGYQTRFGLKINNNVRCLAFCMIKILYAFNSSRIFNRMVEK